MQAQSLLLIDLDRCTRCDECTRACAASHDDVTRLIRDGLRYDKYLVPTSCRSCHDPLCMIGCPVGSIRRTGNLEIVIEDWCIGCGLCAKNCPYGNINMHAYGDAPQQEKAKPQTKAITCDLCADLPEPSCVYACPHEAAHRVDPLKFFGGRR
jgi:Fe-S-cluster-containing hydrogenase component 2